MPHFYKRAVILLTVLSLLMFAMLTAALVAWREHQSWQQALAAVSSHQAQTAVLEQEATAYQTLVAKLGWTPKITVQQMCAEMVAADLQAAQQHALLKANGFVVNVSVE